jgi:hypothetical protein
MWLSQCRCGSGLLYASRWLAGRLSTVLLVFRTLV